ncbi:MAG TPA: Mpo1-like protein [Bacteroidia bacterium]|jgi:uncharacterized membrane protein YGL010W|nr:Mpo1-like protein [Bacteroidia bacterium]
MKSINHLLSEYGESHQNPKNKTIHFVCVPLIFFSIVGLLYNIKLTCVFEVEITIAHVVLILVAIYYFLLSISIAVGMILFAALCIMLCYTIEQSVGHLFIIATIIFILAWIAQFYGHDIEGKKPSFLKDVQFLLIGPAWIMSFLFRKAGISI